MSRRPDFLGTWASEGDDWLVRVEPRSRRASVPKVGAVVPLRVRRKDGTSQQLQVRIIEQHKRYALAEPLDEIATKVDSQQFPAPDATERAEQLKGIDLTDTLSESSGLQPSAATTTWGDESP